MSLPYFRMDRRQADTAVAMIRAAVALTRRPYERLRSPCGVAALATGSGRLFTAATVDDADGFRGTAHALRVAVSLKIFERERDESPIVMAAVFAWRDGDLWLKLPCGGCRETLARHADGDPAILGIDPPTGTPCVVALSALLPNARGEAASPHGTQELVAEIGKHVHDP